ARHRHAARLRRRLVSLLTPAALVAALILPLSPAPAARAQSGGGLTTSDLTSQTPADLVAKIVGGNIPVSNVTYAGAPLAAGTFGGGTGIIGFEDGIVLSSGVVRHVPGPNSEDGKTAGNDQPGDADLTAQGGVPTFDAAALEFDFVPNNTVVSFRYVFSSDEYNEYVNSRYVDSFGFFLNGVNVAKIPGTKIDVGLNTVNGGNPLGNNPSNPQYFVNNERSSGSPLNTEMDGLTVVMTVEAPVVMGQNNHLKLVIADGVDQTIDSNVFIKTGSLVDAPIDATTTTTVTSSNPSAVGGDAITFTAGVAGLVGTPSGAVEFKDNGTPIGSAALSGGVASITTSSLSVGSHHITASYTGNYDASEGSLTQEVRPRQVTPTINWNNPAPIIFRRPLGAAQLNAAATYNGANVPGTFTYSPAAGTVLPVGTHTLSVTFRPTDTSRYTEATASVQLNVGYSVRTIHCETRPIRRGLPFPVMIQLRDAHNANVSAASITVHALGVGLISSSTYGDVEDVGNVNPDDNFRFVPVLDITSGYLFALRTNGLGRGTYLLYFTAGNDPTVHTTQFMVK
ncbi:MAG: choice-of-anchor L domain-containing protein, partial [Pyrinomonadaceae bacterium]